MESVRIFQLIVNNVSSYTCRLTSELDMIISYDAVEFQSLCSPDLSVGLLFMERTQDSSRSVYSSCKFRRITSNVGPTYHRTWIDSRWIFEKIIKT